MRSSSSARTALGARGLADHLAPEGWALELAVECAVLAGSTAPLPLAMTKALLNGSLEAVLAQEEPAQAKLYLSDDHAEGKQAFLETRAAIFRNS